LLDRLVEALQATVSEGLIETKDSGLQTNALP